MATFGANNPVDLAETHRAMGQKPARALLVPVSPGYNLGIDKLKAWLRENGWTTVVARQITPALGDFELYCFSAVFTWDLPRLVELTTQVPQGKATWIGGPAPSAMPGWVKEKTGVDPVIGPDPRFERQRGSYKWCRTTRGCPVGCYFCIVPKIDGKTMLEYDDFDPAPVVVDDNILRSSWRHQELVVEKLEASKFKFVDFNSGFEPLFLEQKHIDLYGRLPIEFWRVAFDERSEWKEVRRSIKLLRANGITKRRISCYVLAGNESFADCMWRAKKVVEWGGEPRIQMMKPLNWLQPRSTVWISPKYDWDHARTINFARYWYSYAWRRMKWGEWKRAGNSYDGPSTRAEWHSKLRETRAKAAARWGDDLELHWQRRSAVGFGSHKQPVSDPSSTR
jgi:hypothetical protein